MTSKRIAYVLAFLFLPGLGPVPGVEQPEAHTDVVAHDVMDRDSLQAFIRRAKAEVEESVSDAKGVYDFADMDFRPQGDWRRAPSTSSSSRATASSTSMEPTWTSKG